MTPEQLTGKTEQHLTELTLDGRTLLLHRKATSAWLALHTKAQQAGFELALASGFRGYERQAAIWNGKFSGQRAMLDNTGEPLDSQTLSDEDKIKAILRWSALPGASRHHWGCDFDVYARNMLPSTVQLQLEPWEYQSGHQQEFYLWLQETLPSLEFFFPYDCDRGGVAAEPWHISYAPISEPALNSLSVALIHSALKQDPILGQQSVLSCLDDIYQTYVTNIGCA